MVGSHVPDNVTVYDQKHIVHICIFWNFCVTFFFCFLMIIKTFVLLSTSYMLDLSWRQISCCATPSCKVYLLPQWCLLIFPSIWYEVPKGSHWSSTMLVSSLFFVDTISTNGLFSFLPSLSSNPLSYFKLSLLSLFATQNVQLHILSRNDT